MRLNQRSLTLGFLIFQTAGALAYLAAQLQLGEVLATTIASGVALVASAALLAAAWRGWRHVGAADTVLMSLAVALGAADNFVTEVPTLIVLTPPAIALILARPIWIPLSMLIQLVIFTLRAGPEHGFWTTYTNDLRTFLIITLPTVAMMLSRMVSDRAQQAARAEADRADAARAEAERQAAEVARQAAELEARSAEQGELLRLLGALETSAIGVADDVLLAPLVGRLDRDRLERLTRRLLRDASAQRARLVILDVAGVAAIDAAVAEGLAQVARALRLLGCAVTITGLTSAVAQTLADTRADFAGVATLRSPQEALEQWRAASAARPAP